MPMMPFDKGSKVKLTDRYAKTLLRAKGNPIWIGRLGTVIYCNKYSVSILWEGRTSVDHVPLKAVELVLHNCSTVIPDQLPPSIVRSQDEVRRKKTSGCVFVSQAVE